MLRHTWSFKMTDHIQTTKTLVAKLRQLAKKRSKTTSLPLHQCLEAVAQEGGYRHWKHLLLCQEKTALDLKSPAADGVFAKTLQDGSSSEIPSQELALIGLR